MQSDKNKADKQHPKIMLDFDGVAIDDITPRIDKRFPKSDTGLQRVYIEALFHLLRPLKNSCAKLIEQPEISIEQNAAKFMRRVRTSDLILCTANPTLDKDRLNSVLGKEGVHGVRIYTVPDKNKIKIAYSERAILVEDDPVVAMRAAKKGVNVILFERKYNKSAGKILPRINSSISIAHSWEEVAKLVSSK